MVAHNLSRVPPPRVLPGVASTRQLGIDAVTPNTVSGFLGRASTPTDPSTPAGGPRLPQTVNPGIPSVWMGGPEDTAGGRSLN